ncbi:uncharacterized protein [Centroberyx affinis]
MLQARDSVTDQIVGQFILLNNDIAQLLSCNDSKDSTVSQRNNQKKYLIQVNWTAPVPRPDRIFFRATFVEDFRKFWENVDFNISTQASSTTIPTTTTPTTQPSTNPGGITSSPTTITSNPTASYNTAPTTPPPPPFIIKLVVMFIIFTIIFYTAISPDTETQSRSSPHHRQICVFKTLCRLLTLIAETVALILFIICCTSITFNALVCMLMFLSLLELFLVLLPIGISHELKDICDITVKVASVIHEIFTIATIFMILITIEEQSWEVCWSVKGMAGYTAWRFLFYIYVFTSPICRGKTLRGGKIGSCKTHSKSKNQGEMMKRGAAAKIDFVVFMIFYFGNAAFAVAVIVGIFS